MAIVRSSWICTALVCVAWIVFAPHASAATQTFSFTGGEQTYVVPAGVHSVHVVAAGAQGGRGSDAIPNVGGSPGFGARVEAELAVIPGQMLFIDVGGTGAEGGSIAGGGTGGFNGGGSSNTIQPFFIPGGGGGGATDIRSCSRLAATCAGVPDTLSSRLVVAGGGGGGGSLGRLQQSSGGEGGDAGEDGLSGQMADCGGTSGGGGGAGTESSGGAGGSAGNNGAPAGNPGVFGQGGAAGTSDSNVEPGGGGGGGYWGGGAGGGSNGCGGGGGGGGSSFAAAGASGVSTATDATGTPRVAITSTDPDLADRDFSFGKLKRNRRTGTARLTLDIPGPGMLTLTGKGLVTQTASVAGQVKLIVRAKGTKKRKLNRVGRVKVNANVVYTPIGADSITKTRTVILVKRHAKRPCTRFCATGA